MSLPEILGGQRFNSRAPWGARPGRRPCSPRETRGFNSRAPWGARPAPCAGRASCYASFNSRAPWGARRAAPRGRRPGEVSIHAPTWGATGCRPRIHRKVSVSIHAPTWGATSAESAARIWRSFQFTRPRGARHGFCPRASVAQCFNSRAHVGRDTAAIEATMLGLSFQFTRQRGARPRSSLWRSGLVRFQFTRPRGARPRIRRLPRFDACFNSRAHVGRDVVPSRPCVIAGFQFTRPRGARREEAVLVVRHVEVSIHAPTWGATSKDFPPCPHSTFQFTRPRGARRGRGDV